VAPYRIRIEGDHETYPCHEGQSVLAALAPVHNLKILSGCKGGGCGICKVQVHDGSYHCQAMSAAHVCAAERDQRFALACKTFPQSDLRIEPCKKLNQFLGNHAAPRG
jgi:ferredoxin